MGKVYHLKHEKLVRTSEYDYCVVCGARTDVKRSQPVDEREHYVEGAGQLCPACYAETYGEDAPDRS